MARMSSVDKEKILIESFEVLKENTNKNSSKISEIIGKMSDINIELAVEMWSYFLENSKELIKENGYSYTSGVLYDIKNKVGTEKTIQILKENESILEACYKLSDDIFDSIIDEIIKYDEVELADQILEMISLNKNKEEPFAYYLEQVCEYFVSEFSDIQDFDEEWDDKEEHEQRVLLAGKGSAVLLEWANTIRDKEQKARLNVTLIDYV